ncbi:hypothetical protein Tco_1539023 [Tanacetum coccineum]
MVDYVEVLILIASGHYKGVTGHIQTICLDSVEILLIKSSIKYFYVKDPPTQLHVDATTDTEIEVDSDGVWSVGCGKFISSQLIYTTSNGKILWSFLPSVMFCLLQSSSHSKPVIVAFSLADEKFSELPPPNLYSEVDMSDIDTKLVALGEKLAIVNEVKGDIWLMNEYGVQKSWTKIVIHGFNEIPMVRPQVFYDNRKNLFLSSDLLWIYDVEEKTFCKSVDISYMKIRSFIGAYAESLVSPKFSISK